MKTVNKDFIEGLIISTIISVLIYWFLVFYLQENGKPWGQSDISYYAYYSQNNHGYFNDMSHWLTLVFIGYMGLSHYWSFIYVYVAFCVFWYMCYGLKNRLLAVFTLFVGTSYSIHIFHIGILSQGVSFLFFCMMVGAYRRKRKYAVLWGLLAVFTHILMVAPVLIYHIVRSYPKYNMLKLCIVGFVIFLIINYYRDLLNIVFLNGVISGENPPIWLVFMILINPLLVGMSRYRDKFWWVFFILALIGHNGRFTMFFMPFMIFSIFKKPLSNSDRALLIMGSIMYFVYVNLLYFPITDAYLKA